ncbi:MAG: molybdopterin-guanine dinucleotide biosynthesis protein MobA, partial [Aeromicrobium sp.]|nr:molybdopterin-guanine dinucleotide biosynthesis protein MobA [Aeromicrobium sp.]
AAGIDALVAASEGDGVIAVDADGRRQQLLSVLQSTRLRLAAERLGPLTGRSVRDLIAPLDLREIVVPVRATMDVDTWDDHRRATEETCHD